MNDSKRTRAQGTRAQRAVLSIGRALFALALFSATLPAAAGEIKAEKKLETKTHEPTYGDPREQKRAREAAERALRPTHETPKPPSVTRASPRAPSPPEKLENGSFRVNAELVSSRDWDLVGPTLRGSRVVLHSEALGDVETQWPKASDAPLRFKLAEGLWVPLGTPLAERLLGGSVKNISELEKSSTKFDFSNFRWLNLQTAVSMSALAKQVPKEQVVPFKTYANTSATLEHLKRAIETLRGQFVLVTGHVEDGDFVSNFAGKEQFRISVDDLFYLFENAGAHMFQVGCHLADVAGTGSIDLVRPREVAAALERARDAKTEFQFIQQFSSVIPLALDDLNLVDNERMTVVTAGGIELIRWSPEPMLLAQPLLPDAGAPRAPLDPSHPLSFPVPSVPKLHTEETPIRRRLRARFENGSEPRASVNLHCTLTRTQPSKAKTMIAESTHQRLLNVMPLAERLTPEDRTNLAKDFPEFNIDSLLEQAGTMGGAESGTPSSDAQRLREIKFQLEIARRALGRIIPDFEKTWQGVGALLRRAATTEFYAGILALLGGGGAAGGAALSQYVPALIGAGVAFVASALSLHSQFQRRSLREDLSLASVYASLTGQREVLLQLRDALSLWGEEGTESLLGNEKAIFEASARALEASAKVDEAVSAVAPLLT